MVPKIKNILGTCPQRSKLLGNTVWDPYKTKVRDNHNFAIFSQFLDSIFELPGKGDNTELDWRTTRSGRSFIITLQEASALEDEKSDLDPDHDHLPKCDLRSRSDHDLTRKCDLQIMI